MESLILIILDGWGIAPPWAGNAIFLAKTPCFDSLLKKYPNTTLAASGEAVGLSGHEHGNSEAGHLNIGAGKVVHQDVSHISHLIKNGSFFKSQILRDVAEHIKKYHSNLHLLGLVSDGGIHSHISHLFALLKMFKNEGAKNIYIHAFTDGRDTAPQNALTYILRLEKYLKEIGVGKIASVSGRYYAMDRDKHWDRTEKAYRVIAEGIGPNAKNAATAIASNYRNGLIDEFIIPTVVLKVPILDNDAVVFFNVRGDRARQLTRAFCEPNFQYFKVKKFHNLPFVTFTWYGDYIPNTKFAFPPEEVKEPLAKVLSEKGLFQFHIAETEKYAHVTYFFNGGREKPFPNEDRIMIPSPKVKTYDLKPEMSASEVAEATINRLLLKKYSFVLVNFANPDMVGHTGNLKAAIKAIEAVDRAVEKVVREALNLKMYILISADHGNAEQMVNPKTGEIDTEHTTNPVPFILIRPDVVSSKLRKDGILADIAPTILNLLRIKKPKEMSGRSLIV